MGVPRCTSLLTQELSRWSWRKFGNSAERLKSLTKQLQLLQCRENPSLVSTITNIQGEIAEILEREDSKWKQRAKQNWYRGGDRNTQYFHAWASQRRKQNEIKHISDEDGNLWRTK
jgi:hypothetical protein